MGIGQKVLLSLLMNDSFVDYLLEDFCLAKQCSIASRSLSPIGSPQGGPDVIFQFISPAIHELGSSILSTNGLAIVSIDSFTCIPSTFLAKYPPTSSFLYTFVVLQNS